MSTPLRLAEVVSRGIPDPRRAEGPRDDISDTSQETLEYEIDVANQAMDEETLQPLLRSKHKRRGGKRRGEEATYGKGGDAWSTWAEARGKGKGQQKGKGKGKPKGKGKYTWGAFAAGINAALNPRTSTAWSPCGAVRSTPSRQALFCLREAPPASPAEPSIGMHALTGNISGWVWRPLRRRRSCSRSMGVRS